MRRARRISYYPSGNVLQRALSSLRHESLATVGHKLASGLGYRRLLRLERRLDEPIGEAQVALPVTIGLLGLDDAAAYAAARPETGRVPFERRLAEGWLAFAVRHEGRIVSTAWATTKRYRMDYLGRDIEIGDGDVCFTDAWTDPAWRGHSLAQALCEHQLRYFRDRGFRRALRATIPVNYSALRAHAKSGFRPTTLHVQLKIGPWRRNRDRPWQAR